MGKETAREMARMGARVILGCHSTVRGQAARHEIIETTRSTSVTVLQVDLSSLASVRAFARAFDERFPELHVLVNNAAASVRAREITLEGFERHWATNVLGPHLLTRLLLPALQPSGHGRIITISALAAGGLDLSDAQYAKRRFSGIAAYRASKQASRMLTSALAGRLQGRPVTANALNPGHVVTDLTRHASGLVKVAVALMSFTAQTALDRADTAIWLAASPEAEGITGKFWDKRREVRCRFRDKARLRSLESEGRSPRTRRMCGGYCAGSGGLAAAAAVRGPRRAFRGRGRPG
jgi:NAD(P)-dependent dehydrogenase (short-subunit alcohol dehydrogenase family)